MEAIWMAGRNATVEKANVIWETGHIPQSLDREIKAFSTFQAIHTMHHRPSTSAKDVEIYRCNHTSTQKQSILWLTKTDTTGDEAIEIRPKSLRNHRRGTMLLCIPFRSSFAVRSPHNRLS